MGSSLSASDFLDDICKGANVFDEDLGDLVPCLARPRQELSQYPAMRRSHHVVRRHSRRSGSERLGSML